jgi:predicted phage-related endonuclease
MAQADSVPTPNHNPNPDAPAQQSATKPRPIRIKPVDRRYFIGGSDARTIMGTDEAALLRRWREKRGELEPEDLSSNLIVQLGVATEDLNRRWYQANSGQVLTDVQREIRHPALRWMAATLDGRVEATGAIFESKFMLPWAFSEEAAAKKYMPQLQHNMWVAAARSAVLSVITGGGKWVEITTHADPLYQHLIVTAERKFWRCVESGEPPRLFGVEPPKPRIEAVRIVDMSASNSWAEFAGLFRTTRQAFLEHERSKSELKALMPEDAKEAIGHGIRARRSKSGAVSFDLLENEARHAAARSLRPWPKPRRSLSIQRSLWSAPFGRIAQAKRNDPSAMHRCRAGSPSCAKPLASMRSRRYKLPRSTRTLGSYASVQSWRMPRENGLPRIGQSAPSARRPRRIVWVPLSPMPVVMRYSHWWALRVRTISMRRIW